MGLQTFFGPNAQKTRDRNRQTSSLRTPNRTIVIVTTASLPWMTGACLLPYIIYFAYI
jgi:hypothetical protein